jgi:hypothetical protein
MDLYIGDKPPEFPMVDFLFEPVQTPRSASSFRVHVLQAMLSSIVATKAEKKKGKSDPL